MGIVAGFNLTVSTHTAAEMKGIIQHFIGDKSSLVNFSITLFDLKDMNVLLHNSNYNQHFQSPTLSPAIHNNPERIYNLTSAENIDFCLQTEMIIMNHLKHLTTEQLRKYEARYIRQLKEKNGQYHSYVLYISVYKFDEFGRPWILKIETKRSEVDHLPDFRWFSQTPDDYIEKHTYTKHLQNVKLTENENTVLGLLIADKTMGFIAAFMKKSPQAVQSYYTHMERKMDVKSVQEIKEIGCIMGY
jgi:DNA-binding CsgD family transcriptional regulator